MWATNVYKSFFKNLLFFMNGGLPKYVLKGFIHVVSTVNSILYIPFQNGRLLKKMAK